MVNAPIADGQTAGSTAPADDVACDPLPFLVRAGEVLAGSLDYDQTVCALLDLVVPALADMCSIHLLDEDGRFRRIGARHYSPRAAALSVGLTDYYMDAGQRDGPIHRLMDQRMSLLSAPVRDEDIDLIVGPERRTRIVNDLGLTSAMVVPLVAREHPFGVLCLSRAVRPEFERAHLHLAEEIGRRAALALDAALLYRTARQSRLEAERARQHMAFLAEASAVLAASLDVRTILQTVVQLAVPRLAESCSLVLVEDDGTLRRVAVAHVDPVLQRALAEHFPIVPVDERALHPIAIAIRTGHYLVENAITDEARRTYASGAYLDLLNRMGIHARLVAPLEAHGRCIGALVLSNLDPARPFDDDDVATSVGLAGRAALALDNVRLYHEAANSAQALQRLVQQQMAAQEDERRRLAYELHDGAAQTAAGAQQYLEAYAHDFPGGSEAARHRMDVAVGLTRQTVSEIRRVLGGLRPTTLDDFGLTRALQAYADGLTDDAFRVTFVTASEPGRISPDLEIALFRTAQEAVTNARKHAQVDAVQVRLASEPGSIVLEVEDHGCGFDRTSVAEGGVPGQRLGLLSMQERIALAGGTFECRSRPGMGTLVRAVVPIARPARRRRGRRTGR